jgi:hypothetical protein
MTKFLDLGVQPAIFLVSLILGCMWTLSAVAATTPSLGTATSYGVLSSTYTNTVAGTIINGDIGFTTAPAIVPGGIHANYGSSIPYASAGIDQGVALSALASQACTFTFAPWAIDLSTDTTHGLITVYTPGVYCSVGAMNIGGPLVLSGNGTFIFRAVGALNSTVGSVVTVTNGASACDVFWTPTGATTLAATTSFLGVVIDDAGITVGASTTRLGLALSFGGTVTTDTTIITVPVCAVVAAPTLHVIKQVINAYSGTAVASDFTIHVESGSVDVWGSPANGTGSPWTLYTLSSGTYIVSEDINTWYTQSFTGDCNASGSVTLAPGDNKTCTIINTDIAPVPVIPPVISTGSLHIIKLVVNANSGTAVTNDFTLYVKSGSVNVWWSPANGTWAPGSLYILGSGTYVVSEDANALYTQSFVGDCNASGSVTLIPGEDKTCTIINTDFPAIIIPAQYPGGGSYIPTIIPAPIVPIIPTPLVLPVLSGWITFTDTNNIFVIHDYGVATILLPVVPSDLPRTGASEQQHMPWQIVLRTSLIIMASLYLFVRTKKHTA